MKILGRGVVGIDYEHNTIFVSNSKLLMKMYKKYRGGVHYVGRIKMLKSFVDNPVYPVGCSPNYGDSANGYETARHCLLNGLCDVKSSIQMSDGTFTSVVYDVPYKACKKWLCWVFARFVNRFGIVLNRCVEEYDNAKLGAGNSGDMPDLILFAGSEDGRLALFVPGLKGEPPKPPFYVRVQSVDYYEGRVVKTWETIIRGIGMFLVDFGDKYTLPFMAYYSHPAGIRVKPGFSGSNAYILHTF